jgi:hypothetical protein
MLGDIFVLYNFDGSVLDKFIIKHHKKKRFESVKHQDGSFFPGAVVDMVSENGYGWYYVIGNMCEVL